MSTIRMYDPNIFAENLKRLMEEFNESKVDVAKLLNVSKSAVTGYCNGSMIPRMDKVETLAHHYNVRLSELLEKKPFNDQRHISLSAEDLRYALWGGEDDMGEDDLKAVLDYAEYVRQRKKK